jgi:CheY-like chemotaxis protein
MGCKYRRRPPPPTPGHPLRPRNTCGDGLLALERLKSNRLLSHIPVIVVTVRDRQEPEEQTRRLCAAAYVQKPIHDDTLMASLQTILATSGGAPEGGPAKIK